MGYTLVIIKIRFENFADVLHFSHLKISKLLYTLYWNIKVVFDYFNFSINVFLFKEINKVTRWLPSSYGIWVQFIKTPYK